MTLPIVVRSGDRPNSSWAPPRASRKPVITSSENQEDAVLAAELLDALR